MKSELNQIRAEVHAKVVGGDYSDLLATALNEVIAGKFQGNLELLQALTDLRTYIRDNGNQDMGKVDAQLEKVYRKAIGK